MNNHFSESSDGLCDINERVSCSIVTASKYSEIFNVPVALFGALWFLVLFWMARSIKKKPETSNLMLLWCFLGLLFIIYMIIAEIILTSLCPFCTIVHVLIIIAFILSIKLEP